jgi:hypothetical protein
MTILREQYGAGGDSRDSPETTRICSAAFNAPKALVPAPKKDATVPNSAPNVLQHPPRYWLDFSKVAVSNDPSVQLSNHNAPHASAALNLQVEHPAGLPLVRDRVEPSNVDREDRSELCCGSA